MPDRKCDCGNHAKAKHSSPASAARQHIVRQIRSDDSGCDGQHVDCHESTAHSRRYMYMGETKEARSIPIPLTTRTAIA